MSDIKNLVELNKLMNNGNSLKNDLTEASNLITSMFQKKYISKLTNELKIQKQEHQKNPTKEIQLIQAVKPFIDKSRHNEIDMITDTLINLITLMDIQKDFDEINKENISSEIKEKQVLAMNNILTPEDDKSIKKDGVYDIDETCLFTNQNVNGSQNINSNMYLYIILILILLMKPNK